MYSNHFVVAIKVNGTAQKELKDGSVIIPFESEYTIHLRNKNRTRNAVAYVYIDGDLVTPTGVVVYKNSFVDLERSTDKAVKFKFVSLQTPEAIEFGKDTENSDKGMGVIEVRWHYEKERSKPVYTPPIIIREEHHHHYPRPWYGDRIMCSNSSSMLRGASLNNAVYGASAQELSLKASHQPFGEVDACLGLEADFCLSEQANTKAKDGCTVEGDYSSQTFRKVHMDIESDYTTIRLVLKGTEPEKMVRTANAQPRGRRVYGDKRSQPKLESDNPSGDLGDTISLDEDPQIIKEAREELIRMELELIAKKKAKLQAELDALNNS
jgi:hypothetical protein